MISPTRDEIHATEPQVECDDDDLTCPACGGRGYPLDPSQFPEQYRCSQCDGTGQPLLADDAEMARLQLARLGHEPDREDDQR